MDEGRCDDGVWAIDLMGDKPEGSSEIKMDLQTKINRKSIVNDICWYFYLLQTRYGSQKNG